MDNIENNEEKKVIGGDGAIKISLAIILFTGIAGFSIRQEARITKLETTIAANVALINKLEERTSSDRELLSEIKYLRGDIEMIKNKLKITD